MNWLKGENIVHGNEVIRPLSVRAQLSQSAGDQQDVALFIEDFSSEEAYFNFRVYLKDIMNDLA